jgi:Protein of unknown function (DUF3617)
MTFQRLTALGAILFMATAVSSAQQKFPMRSGEWKSSTPSTIANQPPTVLLYCLNDELWAKALTQNPSCSITQLDVSLIGASYNMNCSMKTFQMKGKVNMSFDGTTHMISKGSFDLTMNGKITHSESQTDYRWKGLPCNPDTDMNLKFHKQH